MSREIYAQHFLYIFVVSTAFVRDESASTNFQPEIQCNTLENILCRLPHLMYISYNCIQLLSTQQLQEQNDVF